MATASTGPCALAVADVYLMACAAVAERRAAPLKSIYGAAGDERALCAPFDVAVHETHARRLRRYAKGAPKAHETNALLNLQFGDEFPYLEEFMASTELGFKTVPECAGLYALARCNAEHWKSAYEAVYNCAPPARLCASVAKYFARAGDPTLFEMEELASYYGRFTAPLGKSSLLQSADTRDFLAETMVATNALLPRAAANSSRVCSALFFYTCSGLGKSKISALFRDNTLAHPAGAKLTGPLVSLCARLKPQPDALASVLSLFVQKAAMPVNK